MKKWKRISAFLIASIMLLLSCNLDRFVNAADSSAEMIPNGDFEKFDDNDFPTDWQVFAIDNGSGNVSLVNNSGRSGHVVKIDTNDQFAIASHDVTGKIEVESDTAYKLTYWVKIDGDAAVQRTFVRQHNSNMGNTTENPFYGLFDYAVSGSCDWKKVEATFTTASDCKYIYLWLSIYGNGTLYLDDISMKEISVDSDKMIENGDFENVTGTCPDGFMGLSIDGGTGTVSSVDGGFSGNKAVCITPTNGDYALFNHDQSPIKVKGSTNYRISYMVKIPGTGTILKPFIRQLTSTGKDTSENTYYAKYEYRKIGPCDWTQVQVDFKTAPDARKIHIWLIANGEVYIDDLTMFKYTPEQEIGVINGDFSKVNDTGFVSWNFWNGDNSAPNMYQLSVEGDGYSGNSAKVTKKAEGQGFSVLQQEHDIEIKADTTYKVSYWVKTQQAASMKQYVTIRQLQENGADTIANAYITPYTVNGDTEWTEVSFRFKTEKDAAKLNYWFIFTGGDNDATVWYDNIIIEESGENPEVPPVVPEEPPKDPEEPQNSKKIVNGQFTETNKEQFVGWGFWNGPENKVKDLFELSVESDGYSGNSAKITKKSGSGYCVLQQEKNIIVSANTTYKFSYWMKTEQAATMKQHIIVRQFTENGSETVKNAFLTPQQLTGNMEWSQVTFDFTTEKDATSINLWFVFDCADEGATVWYDNAKIERIGEKEGTIVNGSFTETNGKGFYGWLFWNGYENKVKDLYDVSVDKQGRSGNSAKITKKSGEGYSVLQQMTPIAVKANQTYEFSYWIKTKDAANMKQYAIVRQFQEDGKETKQNTYLSPRTVNGNLEWTQVVFRFTTEKDASLVNFWLTFTTDDGKSTVWYDDVALKETDPSSDKDILGFEVEVGGLPHGWFTLWDSLTPKDVEFGMTKGVEGKAVSVKKLTNAKGVAILSSKQLDVAPNTSYELSYWIKSNDASTYNYIFLHQYSQSGEAENAWTWPAATYWQYGKSEWKKVTIPIRTSSNATSLDIRVATGGDKNAIVCYDSFALTKLTDDANLDFESVNKDGSPVNWFYADGGDQGAKLSVDSNISYTGKNSLHITKTTTEHTLAVQSSVFLNVDDAKYYEFSYYVKSRGALSNARAKLDFVIYNEEGVAISTLNTVNAYLSASDEMNEEWKRYNMVLIIPSGGCKGQFALTLSPGIAEIWVDHITLKEIGSVRDEVAYWDDFSYGDRNGNVVGWNVTGKGASLTNVSGKAKFQVNGNNAAMSTELVNIRPKYVYEVTGNYASQKLSEAVIKIKYYDTNYREMTSLVYEEKLSLKDSGTFNTFFTAPSCTTAEISIETEKGILILDDLMIKVSDRPATSSDWRGKWVWFNENAAVSAVRVNRYFRQDFEIDQKITSAIMQITCDDKFALYINGVKVDEELSDAEDTWKSVHVLDIARYLKEGKNTFAVEAYNVVSSAGLIFDARIDLANGVRQVVASGSETLVSPKQYEGWHQTDYNDSQWEKVMVIGAVPVLPWAEIAFDNTYFVDAALEIIETETVDEETECGDFAYINVKMKLAKKLTNIPEFSVNIWKRNTNIKVTSSTLEIVDGSEPTEWPANKPFTVKFRMKVPDFINAGRYTLQLDMNRFKITNDLIYDNKFMDVRFVKTIEADPLTTEVANYNGAPTLMIDGVPEAFMSFLLPISEERHVDTAPSDMSSKGDMNLYLSFDIDTASLWKKDGSIDYDKFDSIIIRDMSFNPDGYFMLSIGVNPPDWWKELHPEEMCIDDEGNVTGVSLTSQVFKEEAGEVVRNLIAHAMEQSYWNKMFGIRLTGMKTAEWLQYGAGLEGSIDYSPSALKGFRDWLKEKYKTDQALQVAWNNRKVTLATATVPTFKERVESEYVSVLNPKTQKCIIDFQDYMGYCASDIFLHMCQVSKEVTHDKLIVGGYHGYIWNSYSYEGNDIVHSGIKRVLESEYVDFICGPQNYNERDLGIPGGWMSAIDSVHANGKLFVQEQDNRTITAPGTEWPDADSGVGKTYTTEDTINQLKRDYSQIITKNSGMWFYDMDGGWFHDDQIYELSSIINKEADLSILTNKKTTSEVAVFVDEKTYEYSTYKFGATYQIYNYLYLEQRFNLGTMGAPYDIYRIDDLCNDKVADYKVNIILSPYQISEEQRAAIDKELKRDGKILIWVFAPGLSDGNEVDVANISALTNINLALKKEQCRLNVTFKDSKNPLLSGLKGTSYGISNEEVGPYIYVNDSKAEALGYLYNTDVDRRQVGLAIKKMEDYTSIYSSAPNLPNLLLQNILKEAGVHIYTDNRDDVLSANEHYVGIHSAFAGKRIVTLPKKHSVYDVYANEFVSMNTDKFEVELRDGESKLYRLMTPNTYAVTVTRNSGGTVSDFGLTEVQPGSSMAIKIKANEGYYVKSVSLNGEDIDVSRGTVKLSKINDNMALKVNFAKGEATDVFSGTLEWLPLVILTVVSTTVIGGSIAFAIYKKRKKQQDSNFAKGGEM